MTDDYPGFEVIDNPESKHHGELRCKECGDYFDMPPSPSGILHAIFFEIHRVKDAVDTLREALTP